MVELESCSEGKSKKKRSLPGMPDPESEVIALSPGTLMATNRFVCEICSKGFQRDQNLQLHRRGHNLPWKLRQRGSGEAAARKRVYVCPEATCVHHSPGRALGDLTGIKKHFSRKHGEKKWKCERCSKRYAVHSDWKAHMKTCGTREYKCDCGTVFSRRDSFITHRAFCDALAQHNIIPVPTPPAKTMSPPPPPPSASPSLSIHSSSELAERERENDQLVEAPVIQGHGGTSSSSSSGMLGGAFSSTAPAWISEPTSLSLYGRGTSSMFQQQQQDDRCYGQPAAMSATALLQKAAQMGPAASNGFYLQGSGLAMSSPVDQQENVNNYNGGVEQWNANPQNSYVNGAALGMGLSSSSMFGNRPATLDFLGLGVGPATALLSSFAGTGFNAGGGRNASPPETNANANALP